MGNRVNRFITGIGLVLLVLAAPPRVLFAERMVVPNSSPDHKVSKYEYKEDDIPNVCFFPKEEARWDGYKVTNWDWIQFTDYQKERFITEGVSEIEKNENAVVNMDKKWRVLSSVNTTVNMLLDKFPYIKKLVLKILYDSLKDESLIRWNSEPKGSGKWIK